jgi:hypothetical protein
LSFTVRRTEPGKNGNMGSMNGGAWEKLTLWKLVMNLWLLLISVHSQQILLEVAVLLGYGATSPYSWCLEF